MSKKEKKWTFWDALLNTNPDWNEPDNPVQFLLPPAIISEEDELYADCAKEGINLIDRVNGKPVAVYHYSIDRPSANWHSPKEDESEYFDDADDDDLEDKPQTLKESALSVQAACSDDFSFASLEESRSLFEYPKSDEPRPWWQVW